MSFKLILPFCFMCTFVFAQQKKSFTDSVPDISFKELLKGYYFKNPSYTFRVSNIIWAPGKIEPHPFSIPFIDSLAIVLRNYPEVAVILSAHDPIEKNTAVNNSRAQYIADLLKTRFQLSNSFKVDSNVNDCLSGLLIRFKQ